MPTVPLVIRHLVPALLLAVAFGGNAAAQQPPAAPPKLLDLLNQGDGLGQFQNNDVLVSAELTPATAKPGDTVTLSVSLFLPPGHYTYPQKTSAGTKIRIKTAEGLQPLGKGFTPSSAPKQKVDPDTKDKTAIFDGSVTWSRKFKVVKAPDAGLSIGGSIFYQVCNDRVCKPVTATFVAQAGSVGSKPPVTQNTSKNAGGTGKVHPFSYSETPTRGKKAVPDPVTLKFELKPKTAKPGDEVTLAITATFKKGWHAYALTHKKGGFGLPIVITVKTLNGLEPTGKGWRPTTAPLIKKEDDGKTSQYHKGTVVWTRKFKVAKAHGSQPVGLGRYGVSGRFRYQICENDRCLFPKNVSYSLGDLNAATPAPKAASDIDPTPFPRSAKVDKDELVYALIVLLSVAFSVWLVVGFSRPDVTFRRRWMARATAATSILFACAAGSHMLNPDSVTSFFAFLQRSDVCVFTGLLFGAALASWPMDASLGSASSSIRRWLLRGTAAALLVSIPTASYAATSLTVELPWQPYSQQRLKEELDKGSVVMIDFTADW